jgi:hypothetical protein
MGTTTAMSMGIMGTVMGMGMVTAITIITTIMDKAATVGPLALR